MRLDKYLSHCTALSRKQSRAAIKSKQVTVNDEVITDFGLHLHSNQTIKLKGESLSLPKPRYYMLHKPSGVVCANSDPSLPCVSDYFDGELPGLNVAGRLDKDTTGLVLLSDDGDWIHKVISPTRSCNKMYLAELDTPVTEQTVQTFSDGVLLRGESKPTRPAVLEAANENGTKVKVTIQEGRYHQVKRMFAACGHHVRTLHRLQIGGIKLDRDLKPGHFRHLKPTEIESVSSNESV